MKKISKPPRVLIIAGSDSGGGAGVQGDIKSVSANGAYAATAITSITVQNTLGVSEVFDLPVALVEGQIRAVLDDIGADVIKTGMLSNTKIIEMVARIITEYKIPAIIDPVMVAKGGASLLAATALKTLKTKLLPKAFLLTPNIPEAEILCGFKIKNENDMLRAAKFIISEFGCNAVLLKGGHLKGEGLVDILVQKNSKSPNHQITKLPAKRISTKNTHGTGCAYASAISAEVAKGVTLAKSVKAAHTYLQGAIKHAPKIGKGHGPVNHFWLLK